MKTRSTIYHCTLAFTCGLIVAVFFCSCAEQDNQKENKISAKIIEIQWFDEYGDSKEEVFTIIQIDSCEYLSSDSGSRRIFTHKGNCKFCAERNKK